MGVFGWSQPKMTADVRARIETKILKAKTDEEIRTANNNLTHASALGESMAAQARANAEAARKMRDSAMQTLAEPPPDMPSEVNLNGGEGIAAGIAALMGMGATGANSAYNIATNRQGIDYKNQLAKYSAKVGAAGRQFDIANNDYATWRGQDINLGLDKLGNARQTALGDLADARARRRQLENTDLELTIKAGERATQKAELDKVNRTKLRGDYSKAIQSGDWEEAQRILTAGRDNGLDIASDRSPGADYQKAFENAVSVIVSAADKMPKSQFDAEIANLKRTYNQIPTKVFNRIADEQITPVRDRVNKRDKLVDEKLQLEIDSQKADNEYKKAIAKGGRRSGGATGPYARLGGSLPPVDGSDVPNFDPGAPSERPGRDYLPDKTASKYDEGVGAIASIDSIRSEIKRLEERMKKLPPVGDEYKSAQTQLNALRKDERTQLQKITEVRSALEGGENSEFKAHREAVRKVLKAKMSELAKVIADPKRAAEHQSAKEQQEALRKSFRQEFLVTL